MKPIRREPNEFTVFLLLPPRCAQVTDHLNSVRVKPCLNEELVKVCRFSCVARCGGHAVSAVELDARANVISDNHLPRGFEVLQHDYLDTHKQSPRR